MFRKAKTKDVSEIKDLINAYSKKEKILPRSFFELFEHIRDFILAECDGKIVGCCALHVFWEDLAEVRSLIVRDDYRNRGIGKTLLKKAIDEARELGIKRVFVLTTEPTFFEQHGFQRIKKKALPHKVWSECIKCIYFPDCKEIPLLYKL